MMSTTRSRYRWQNLQSMAGLRCAALVRLSAGEGGVAGRVVAGGGGVSMEPRCEASLYVTKIRAGTKQYDIFLNCCHLNELGEKSL